MSPRVGVLLIVTCVTGAARAQNPDIFFNIDGRMQFLTGSQGPTFVRFYDNLGHHSVGSVTFYTEAGFQGYVSEKFERIPGDADHDLLDQYYIEDPGIWRLGKQYLPFGAGRFLHESVPAARVETQLVVEGFPIVFAACDDGNGRQRGVVGRVGSRLGFSFALGEHFGINATSFCLVRRPEDSPGVGRGYKAMFGVDYSRNVGPIVDLGGEAIMISGGETASDPYDVLFDVTATLRPDKGRSVTAGWTRDNTQRADFYRLMASFSLTKNFILEPIVRYRNTALFDAGLTLHFKF